MAIADINTHELFTAEPSSPSPDELLLNLGDPVILRSDLVGIVALGCIKPNRDNPESAVILRDDVAPSVLVLHDAIAYVHDVITIDPQTQRATVDLCNRVQTSINGRYSGPGSILSLAEIGTR